MIFDIYGKQIDGKLVIPLPYHDFKWTDKIALRRVIIDWKTKEKAFAVIKSTLVDLGPNNPKQQLLAFSKPASTTITDIDIPDPEFYRVQIRQMDAASITVDSIFEKSLPQIKNIYLQLVTLSQNTVL